MKEWRVLFVLLSLALVGCREQDVATTQLSPTHSAPYVKEVKLSFQPLQLESIQQGIVAPELKLIRTINFGLLDNNPMVLSVYEDSFSTSSFARTVLHGILNVNEQNYLIRDLSFSLKETEQISCAQVCVFQRVISPQDQYEMIGSIELFANGPGLQLFLVYDKKNKSLNAFQHWGEASFVDLDLDGKEEFIIEFPGLHLALPDLTVIRSQSGELEVSASVLETIRDGQGDYVTLNKSGTAPIIQLKNDRTGIEQARNYSYNQGILKAVK